MIERWRVATSGLLASGFGKSTCDGETQRDLLIGLGTGSGYTCANSISPLIVRLYNLVPIVSRKGGCHSECSGPTHRVRLCSDSGCRSIRCHKEYVWCVPMVEEWKDLSDGGYNNCEVLHATGFWR